MSERQRSGKKMLRRVEMWKVAKHRIDPCSMEMRQRSTARAHDRLGRHQPWRRLASAYAQVVLQ
ncbi:hypothetical protein, partial [Ralstonia solanacearum]|uniref:hypothetical protein n=1 Tax=Ralstonia solanacearum TaxID=305 RepID=UPI001E39EEFB